MLYVRQEEHASYLDPTSIKKFMNDTASMEFKDCIDNHCLASEDLSNKKEVSMHTFIDLLLFSFFMFRWKSKIIIIKVSN